MKEIITDIEKLPDNPTQVLETNVREREQNKIMRETIVELKRIIREKNLDGLSACQIGVNERILVMKFSNDNLQSYINPVIIQADGMVFNRETCIHIPDKQFLVPRYKAITVAYVTPLGKYQSAKFVGRACYVMQHLLWHMDGLFIDDVGFEIDDDWDKLTDEEKTTIIKEYAESLDQTATEYNDDLMKSEEGRKIINAVEFEKAVKSGEVKIHEEEIKIINKEEKDEHTPIQEGIDNKSESDA